MKNNFCYFPVVFFCCFLCFSDLLAQGVDTVPPQVTCKQEFSINVCVPTGGLTLHVLDFIESVSDNLSTISEITLGIRKKCTGDGFPVGKTLVAFTFAELGYAEVEVWAKDQTGNTSFCQFLIEIRDNSATCDPGISVNVHTPGFASPIERVTANLYKNTCQNEITNEQVDLPYGPFGAFHRPGDNFIVTPSKVDNPLNGVTTYDLALIAQHIALNTFSPYQLIAADANQDGKVTTYDIVLLRQLILGIITELPNQKSWRFMPYDYEFPDLYNPFSPPFPERIEVPRSADPVPYKFWFFGVKIGDVDYSADLK